MRFLLLSISLLTTAAPAFATDHAVLAHLQPKAGRYNIIENDAAHPCGHGRFDASTQLRLRVWVPEADAQFEEKGDVMVQVEQFGTSTNEWYPAFDQPAFFRINGWAKRYFLPSMGAWVTHKSTFDAASGKLTHSASVNTLTGSGAGEQTIVFQSNDVFTYTYEVVDYNALGRETKRELAARCQLARQE